MGGKGWVPCQLLSLGEKSNGGENWGQSMCKTIANSIVNANFADACATFQDVIAKNINNGAKSTNWLVGSRV